MEAKSPESADETANSNPESVTQLKETLILPEEHEADTEVTQGSESPETDISKPKINQDIKESEKEKPKSSKKTKPHYKKIKSEAKME